MVKVNDLWRMISSNREEDWIGRIPFNAEVVIKPSGEDFTLPVADVEYNADDGTLIFHEASE